jgi:pSer/pThr/pTyr-binding forkhead associated (FHA) protein
MGSPVLVSSVEVEELLLALKVAFLVLLYLFIWRIVRTASRDVRLPQESFVLTPEGARDRRGDLSTGRLVVLESPAFPSQHAIELDSTPLDVGRALENEIQLEQDEYASSRHARLTPQRDGVWLEDTGSTNGTFVNGVRLTRAKRLEPGDVIRIGETDFRYER